MIKDGKNYEYLDIRYVIAITNDAEDPSARWEYIYLNPGTTEEEGIKAAKEEWGRRKEGNVICVDLHRAVIETDENGFIDIFDPENPFHPEYKNLLWPEEIKEEGFALYSIDHDGEYIKDECKGKWDIKYMVLELNKAYELSLRFFREGDMKWHNFYNGYAKGISRTLAAFGVKLIEKEDGTLILG